MTLLVGDSGNIRPVKNLLW